ncbi:hypothetical protein GCM10011416_03350 [Polaribacter pacificus]|uniref:TonB dependent receptor n=1 Tax=Polaribacter pacificus TaxID=1775173 RepID=A0A917HU28_9FLAO|nr:TonB-dependent receptor [Polaribacter pacificus]GGG90108.1 hypothetical protein GCM10011416_03350 [Polaribacter pacificus]
MQKSLSITAFLLMSTLAFSQQTKTVAKDTIKTEVVNVISSYSPSISDAFKIKNNPNIKLSAKTQKKTVRYEIYSAPVASTFSPKTGAVKALEMSVRELAYKNYLAAGFGNNTTVFLEAFLQHSTRPDNEFGLYTNFNSSEGNIDNIVLDNNYSNLHLGTYYKQAYTKMNLELGADFKRDQYNWYGLPASIPFNAATINAIDEAQVYTNFDLSANFDFQDSNLKNTDLLLSYFTDDYNSKELRLSAAPQWQFSLNKINENLTDLTLDVTLDYLTGSTDQTYGSVAKREHGFFTMGLAPKYYLNYNDLEVKLGAKAYLASDLENKSNQFFIYPDVQISYPLMEDYISMYVGAGGDLKTNSYKGFAEENRFISPTQMITQTNEKYSVFGGFNGKITPVVGYHIKASYHNEEDKALFIRNNSKSNGTAAAALKGYEYGNSFSVIYDDVKTFSLFGQVSFNLSKDLQLGVQGTLNSFDLSTESTAWNLPKLTGEIFGNYTSDKWYAGTNIYYARKQYDVTYAATYPSARTGAQTLKSYIDVNLNGGYYINKKFTAFVKINNLLNSDYARQANFNVQGFQVLGGVSYKFDF